ncbi:AAA family ATPase, partial [Candidatus Woesearchaeota archaeon]|nr:AAA family ATPase [Candidatus Woesearchaeota archaeon]
MPFSTYREVLEDVEYGKEILNSNSHGSEYAPHGYWGYDLENLFPVSYPTKKKLHRIWKGRIEQRFDATKNGKTQLGKFISNYPHLPFKEFLLLIELSSRYSDYSAGIIIDETTPGKDPFYELRIRFESSWLKRYKLVFRINNPLKPMVRIYEVSFKAQLALQGKKYTEEYEQLDLALEEEAKRNSPEELDSLYYSIKPKVSFNDLIVPDKVKESLKTAIVREEKKELIFNEWGLKNAISYGKGTTLNFRGPPGTGKTLAAMVLANEMGKSLLMVRYDQLQNCFVGQTEKHIQRVFAIAKTKKAVLFFDEADAIALDRGMLGRSWEMSQVNTLLKELERFEGVCIFATNFAEKYDSAFERRLTMHIDFPLPKKEDSARILGTLLPKKARDPELKLEGLNLEELSGGDLKNVVLNAAGLAAKEGTKKIGIKHIEEAVKMVKEAKSKEKGKDT